MKLVNTKFKSGGLHEKHVVANSCFSCSPPDLNLVVTNFMFCIRVTNVSKIVRLVLQFEFNVYTFAESLITYLHGNPTREAHKKEKEYVRFLKQQHEYHLATKKLSILLKQKCFAYVITI